MLRARDEKDVSNENTAASSSVDQDGPRAGTRLRKPNPKIHGPDWVQALRLFYFYIFRKYFLQKYIFNFTIYSFVPLPPARGAAGGLPPGRGPAARQEGGKDL